MPDSFEFNIPFKNKEITKPRKRPDVQVTKQDVLQKIQVTHNRAREIERIPQGTTPWLDSRKYRLTASNFGAAIGVNRYKSPNGLLKDMLWHSFKGNAATRWGSEHEDIARDAYIAVIQKQIDEGTSPYKSIRVEETGLFINPETPWLGSSPDGIVHVTLRDGTEDKFLLEIKCPFRKQLYANPTVPIYYNAQIQGIMAIMGLPRCDFVVWTPSEMGVTTVPFDAKNWNDEMLPRLQKFYFERYLPAVVARDNGLLDEGEIEVELIL